MPRGRRGGTLAVRAAVAAVVVISTTVHALAWVAVRGSLERHEEAARALGERLARTQADLDRVRADVRAVGTRTDALRRDVDLLPDPAAIVEGARDSVFSVYALGSSGTGFVLAAENGRSMLVTNFHVVERTWAQGRRVELIQDDESHRGRVVGVTPRFDLAVIAVDVELPPLQPVEGAVRVGDPVVVLGSPLGLQGSASTGVVSAIRDEGVQFSAPISPGSSGGPVLDRHGEVIGIAEAKLVGRGVEGLSFAIPIDRVCRRLIAC